MAAHPWLTSNELIEAVKRKISMPLSQNTFDESDVLSFTNEELMIGQVPTLLQYHEEYFVYNTNTSLVANQSRYAIPDRAIGMRLRSVFYVDEAGNLFDMTRASNEEQAFYQRNVTTNTALTKYYLEGNDIVIMPQVGSSPTGSIQFSFFLRPNQLVGDDRAQIIESFTQTLTIDNTTLINGDTLTINDVILTAKTSGATTYEFNIGGTSILSATALVALLNANLTALGLTSASNVTGTSAIITLVYPGRNLTFDTTNEDAFTIPDTLGITTYYTDTTDTVQDSVNTIFAVNDVVDFLQTKPGHKIQTYDISLTAISGAIMTFATDDIPTTLVVGDYICLANECIIPQIPPELHSGLAERTCSRILAAIGDQAGLQASQGKLQEISGAQNQLLDNRTESNPIKVKNRNSLLSLGKMGSRRGY